MDCKKEVYLLDKSYIGKVSTTEWSTSDLDLFTKYDEPEISVGGDFDDGTTSFTIENSTKLVKSQSPFAKTFSTIDESITYEEAGARAHLYVETIEDRIRTVMEELRAEDATSNVETVKIVVI